MITREDYMTDSSVSHEDYYYDVLMDARPEFNLSEKFLKECKEHLEGGDKNLNKISLDVWDSIVLPHAGDFKLRRAFRVRGDYTTQSGLVCLVKEYVRRKIIQITLDFG